MTAFDEEDINAVPGIHDDPDDAEPWAANPWHVPLRRNKWTLATRCARRRAQEGWRGPIGFGGGNDR